MCSRPEFWSTLLLLPTLVALAISIVLQHRFLGELESRHPTLWRSLAQRRVITEDGDKSYAAAQWYLATGEYKTLKEPELIPLGDKARLAFLAGVVMLLAWVSFGAAFDAWPRLGCLL